MEISEQSIQNGKALLWHQMYRVFGLEDRAWKSSEVDIDHQTFGSLSLQNVIPTLAK